MKKHLTSDLLLYPIWKIILYDGLEFFVLGENKKEAKTHILLEDTITLDDIEKVSSISVEEAQNILIDTDGSFDNFDTLYNEAIWVQHDKELHYLVGTCFDIVADLNLTYDNG